MDGPASVPILNETWIKDDAVATIVAWVVVVAGFMLLYNAYNGRGRQYPWFLGSLIPF